MNGIDVGALALSIIVLGVLIPAAFLMSRDRLRAYRRQLVLNLEHWIYEQSGIKPLPSFDAARIKYGLPPFHDVKVGLLLETDAHLAAEASGRRSKKEPLKNFDRTDGKESAPASWLSYGLPIAIYGSVASLGFYTTFFLSDNAEFWKHTNFLLSGIGNFTSATNAAMDGHDQRVTGAAISAAFLGAYMFSLRYLMQKVRTYELSPTSFLTASLQIVEGSFLGAMAWHLLSAIPELGPGRSLAGLTPLLFLIGFLPAYGITWCVERLRLTRLKQTDQEAYRRRYILPIDMIDGVDLFIKFRLAESNIHDVQNLATANPVLLFVETPFNLLTIMDWIAQAQLIVAVGSAKSNKLRDYGIRTIFDFQRLSHHSYTRKLALTTMYGDTIPSETIDDLFFFTCANISDDIHVQRFARFWDTMMQLMYSKFQQPHPLSAAFGNLRRAGNPSDKAEDAAQQFASANAAGANGH